MKIPRACLKLMQIIKRYTIKKLLLLQLLLQKFLLLQLNHLYKIWKRATFI